MSEEVAHLREQVEQASGNLRQLRDKRFAGEREGADLVTVRAAIRLTGRDIDAVTSPELEALIDEVVSLEEAATRHTTGILTVTVRRQAMIRSAGVHGRTHWVGAEVADQLDEALAHASHALRLDAGGEA